MSSKLYTINAFTNVPFQGNPAAVCLLDGSVSEDWMQKVAREMNLSETAFVERMTDGFSLRWFTPLVEVDLCGHATLAAAFVLWHTRVISAAEQACFHTKSGLLTCVQDGEWIIMDFPLSPLEPAPEDESRLAEALGVPISSAYRTPYDFLVEIASETALRGLQPHMDRVAALSVRGVIVTARPEVAGPFDFISRCFYPACGVAEDPVTGSAHCALGTYWRAKLEKSAFTAYQASPRGGTVRASIHGNRVRLSGQALLMSQVELFC
jgi:PhzF family phenazine biosynthesis protein